MGLLYIIKNNTIGQVLSILIIAGFFYRVIRTKNDMWYQYWYVSGDRARFIVLCEIVVVILMSIWLSKDIGEIDSLIVPVIFITPLLYNLKKKVSQSDKGVFHSFLPFIETWFVSITSFIDFPESLFVSVIEGALAVIIYKRFNLGEKRTNLYRIIVLCVETVVVSSFNYYFVDKPLMVVLVLLFNETALFSFNDIIFAYIEDHHM